MAGFRRAVSWLGLVQSEDEAWYADELAIERESAEPPAAERHSEIATIHPVTFQDARTVGSYFRSDVPVVLNLSGMNDAEAKRFIDFASGLILGRRGTLERISGRVFLLLPYNVAVLSADDPEISADGFYNQS